MADTSKKVSELETASQVNNTDLMMLSQGSAGSGFASLKTTILALAQKIITGINFTSALETESKTIAGAINEVAQGGGGGHTILDDSGTSLAQEDDLQFKGVYSHDDSTNGKTVVQIVREFQSKSAIEALTGEEAKGFQYLDDDVYDAFTASEIGFDNSDTSFTGNDVQEVLEEVDSSLDTTNGRIDSVISSLEWKQAGSIAIDGTTGDWNLSADISNAKEVLLLLVAGATVRTSVVIPMARIKDSTCGADYMFAGNRNYIFFEYRTGTKLYIVMSAQGGGTQISVGLYYR